MSIKSSLYSEWRLIIIGCILLFDAIITLHWLEFTDIVHTVILCILLILIAINFSAVQFYFLGHDLERVTSMVEGVGLIGLNNLLFLTLLVVTILYWHPIVGLNYFIAYLLLLLWPCITYALK